MAEQGPNFHATTPRPLLGIREDGAVADYSLSFELAWDPAVDRLREAPVLFDFVLLEPGKMIATKVSEVTTILFYKGPDWALYARGYNAAENKFGRVFDCQDLNAGMYIGETFYWESGPPQIKQDCHLRLAVKGGLKPYIFSPVTECTEPVPNIEAEGFWEL